MAIDTENKRRSVMGVWGAVRILPVPIAGVDAQDRAHIWIYRGPFDGAVQFFNAIFFGINA